MKCARCTNEVDRATGGYSEEGRLVCRTCVMEQTIAAGDREVERQKENLKKVNQMSRATKLVQSAGAIVTVIGALHTPRWPLVIAIGIAISFAGGITRMFMRSTP